MLPDFWGLNADLAEMSLDFLFLFFLLRGMSVDFYLSFSYKVWILLEMLLILGDVPKVSEIWCRLI